MMCDTAIIIRDETHKKEVIGEINSAGQREFFTAGQNGFKPEYVIKMWFADYSGERVIEVDGIRYAIYRTFKIGNFINLYCERRTGLR